MTFCYYCSKITTGEPLFCSSCGRTYDLKLCPRLHPNPRSSEVCSRCGSRELSTPQPRVSLRWKFLEWLLRTFFGILVVVVTLVLVFGFITELLQTQAGQTGVILLGMLLILLSWVWSKLPEWLRKFIRKHFIKRKGTRDEA